MLRALIGIVGIASMLAAAPALAVSTIDRSQRVALPRTDPGTGLCGNLTHFAPAMPLSSRTDAETLLNEAEGSPDIVGRTARIFGLMSFANAQPGANGDFPPPGFAKARFPYSNDVSASPPGNDVNFALRLRGYLSVPAARTGHPISFGLNCDDFCALTIATTAVFSRVDSRVSARVIKQVLFTDPGLYPVELVYFQNGSLAYLEWSQSDTAVPECANGSCTTPLTDPVMYPGQFELLAQEELYSSVVGSQPACQECGAPAMPDCAAGSYCGDGLCQACVTAEHCGSACVTCPANRYVCSAGSCVACVSDDQCPNGEICNLVLGNCIPPAPCAYQSDCPIGMECDACTPNFCRGPPAPCTADSQCPTGQLCGTRRFCAAPPVPCSSDAMCPPRELCDTTAGFCTCSLTKQLYVGGCAAGKTWAAGRETGALLGLGLLCSIAALTRTLRRRRVCVRVVPVRPGIP